MLSISKDIDHDSTTLFRRRKKKLFLDPRIFDADTLVHPAIPADLSGIYRSILRAVTEEGSRLKAVERAEGVRQVILFANGVLVFECSCLAMSIRLLIKIKETAYLVERRA